MNSNDESAVTREDLDRLEKKLMNDVDVEFFDDPKQFRSLHRVIDILGAQLLDSDSRRDITAGGGSSGGHQKTMKDLNTKNPAYIALMQQQAAVEFSIEHMSVAYCSDLNGSVVSVGKVARQFSEARSRIKNLRQQVRAIKNQLHHNSNNNDDKESDNHNGKMIAGSSNNQNGAPTNSLRELWLKKLECEAVLSLLRKLEIIREAPLTFDSLIMPRSGQCRIGAAVTLLSNAINTMFSDDVAQIQALTKIMDQLMTRKQKAEEIVWDTLYDVIYLSTGNNVSPVLHSKHTDSKHNKTAVPGGDVFGSSDPSKDIDKTDHNSTTEQDYESDDYSDTSSYSGFSSPSENQSVSSSDKRRINVTGRMIPATVMDQEIDLEEDELLCLEDAPWDPRGGEHVLPRYSDATLSLRILIEAIARLGRLDDVERLLNESLERKIKKVAQKTQAKTAAFLEKRRASKRSRNREKQYKSNSSTNLPFEYKYHFYSLLHNFGNVMLRLSHLAQILRHRISSDPQLVTPSYPVASQALHGVLKSAYDIMQQEIRTFLCASLAISDPASSDRGLKSNMYDAQSKRDIVSTHERGLFSLGIISNENNDESKKGGTSSNPSMNNLKSNTFAASNMQANEFITNVLVPMTNIHPQLRYAITFRKRLERWILDNFDLKKELATVSNEDTTRPSYGIKTETALEFLDKIIEKEVLPVLQELAVNCTVSALEREDAFEPRIDNIYSKSYTHTMSDVDMCVACSSLLDATTPLFSALHRLPKGSEMYTPLVAVLDYSLLTFISRVKLRVKETCTGKKASELLEKEGGMNSAMEIRKAFSLLCQEYGERPDVVPSDVTRAGNQIQPLAPSNTDTRAKYNDERKDGDAPSNSNSNGTSANNRSGHNPVSDLEREDDALEQEIRHLLYLLQFSVHNYGEGLAVCTDEELMQAACLAHSLLKFANLLEKRLKNKGGHWAKTTTRGLREAVRTIKQYGIKMAKFCRMDMLIQVIKRMSKICLSSAITSKDNVRLPSCVNDLGEYLTTASDNLRETGSNAIAAYTFSSLEQYIPLLLMQTVRRIGKGEGLQQNAIITLNGVEALDRSGSVLYRDLKGSTSFDGSFWDDAAAADAFERSATFIALLELDMDEFEAHYRHNPNEFSDGDYKLMFALNGPRRKGDISIFNRYKDKQRLALRSSRMRK